MTGDRPLGNKIDRYVRGELNPAEARELAQASLDSPVLFDELADSALAKAALYSATLPNRKIVRFPRKAWFVIGGVAAAAVLISLVGVRPERTKPVLSLSAANGQPALLASGLQPAQTGAPVFRSPQTSSRGPQLAGSVVSIGEGLATIDLGSLDGLANGSELQVFRDDRPAETIARLRVITVFRERARGRTLEGNPPRVKDRVRVDDAAHLDALLEQVDALYNRGDRDAAYTLAEQANGWVEAAHVPPSRQPAFLNQLAVLRMLRADYRGAEAPLSRAAATSPKTDPAYARSVNNLGVLAELRGDRRQAESRYADAVQAFASMPDSSDQERRAAEANLARIRGSR
jgi:hypothetical protein